MVFQYLAAAKYPESIRFIEFGPGKGTLIHDIMKTFNKFVEKLLPSDQKRPKIEIALIEASHVLRKEQWKLLCNPEDPMETTGEGYNRSATKWVMI